MSFLLVLFAAAYNVLYASSDIALSEELLWQYSHEENPEALRLQQHMEEIQVLKREFDDHFAPSAFARALHRRTHEEAFIDFQPVVSPMTELEAGLRKQWPLGLSAQISVGLTHLEFDLLNQRQSPSIASIQTQLILDLWKNVFGHLDKLQTRSLQFSGQEKQLSRDIGHHTLWMSLRSLYWNTVALEEQLKIAQHMFNLATDQEKDAERRYRSGVADLAELSLYRAQSTSRSYNILALTFKRENELKALKNLLPQLKGTTPSLTNVDIAKAKEQVLECVSIIGGADQVPLQHTLYDDWSNLVSQRHQATAQQAERYSDPDVQLQGQAFSLAVDSSSATAFGEAFTKDRQGFAVQLQVSVPFGRGRTEKEKVALEQLKAKREALEVAQKIHSNHEFLLRSIPLLLQSIEAQKSNIHNLKARIQEVAKKYYQARVSISDYILDQDRLLQSEMQLLDIENMVVQTMLQYLAIFSQTPCPFNQAPKA